MYITCYLLITFLALKHSLFKNQIYFFESLIEEILIECEKVLLVLS